MKTEHETDRGQIHGDGRSCLVVMYHYVRSADPRTASGIRGLTPAAFEEQLALLCRDREPTDWPSLYAWRAGRGDIPRRCFLLTFDDGLTDHYHAVLPILEDWRIHGVFFVPGMVLCRRRMLTAHAVHLLLATLDDETLRKEIVDAAHRLDTHATPSIDHHAAARVYHYESPDRAALKYLINMTLPVSLSRRVIDELFAKHLGDSMEWADRWYLSWDQVFDLQARGHTIGGHGFSHDPLALQPGAIQRHDCLASRGILEKGLGKGLRPFSYPFGSVDATTMTACQRAGFAQGFSTHKSMLVRGSRSFELPRVDTIDVEHFLMEDQACLQA